MRERLVVIFVALLIGGIVGGGGILFIARSADSGKTIEGHPVSYWVKCLSGEDESLRQHAISVLPRFGADGIAPAMSILGDGVGQDPAVEVLGRMGQPAVEPLRQTLRTGSSHARVGAIRALEKLGPKLATPAVSQVAQLLDDDEAGPFASEFLSTCGTNGDAVSAALRVAESRSAARQVDALKLLGHASGTNAQVVEVLRQKCEEKDPRVREAAFESLCGLNPPVVDAAPIMIAHLGEGDMRLAARIGIARLGTFAIKPLHACTTCPTTETRVDAVNLLANLVADPSADNAMLDFLNDNEPAVNEAAAVALEPMRQRDLGFVRKQLTSPHAKVRMWAIRELRKIQPPLIDEIAPLLDDHDENVRVEASDAIHTLWQADDPAILYSPKSKDPQERVKGIRLLPFFRDPRKYEMMLVAMEDSDPTVRLEAARALGRSLTSGRAVTRLVEAMKSDPLPQIRAEAAMYLSSARSTMHVEEALQAATRDPDATVAEAAKQSLARHEVER